MDLDIFKKNVVWNSNLVMIQANHAEKASGKAKSGYYKVATILAASIVEACAFRLLEENSHLNMPMDDFGCKESYLLPQKYAGDSFQLSICKRFKEQFCLKKHTDFKKVNEVCLKIALFSKDVFNKIEKVREFRNKIHIQGLRVVDRSYSKKELEFISSIMVMLLNKLNFEK